MAKINLLSPMIFNRIAAGEVVEKPCSVVKELVENSIDSGASDISVCIERGGLGKIEVTDNGSGIEFDDLKNALLAHATSKISNLEDLDNIGTLGFRGEALSSIASVSEIEIISKTPDCEFGGKINCLFGHMEECNNFCSYCIVPYVRGREKSRDKEEILKEVKALVESKKYDTITLLGQNVNSYGNDKNDGYHFADLLIDICKIPGDFHVGFMTSHPKDIDEKVIDVLATEDKMLKELHLPVQSGNDRILKLMNRNYTIEKYLGIVKNLRAKIPNIRLSTDIIVGFPSETEEEFMDTVRLIEEVKYDQIFAFMYSPRPHTRAAEMPDQIPAEEKNRRVNYLLNLQKTIQKGKGTNDIR